MASTGINNGILAIYHAGTKVSHSTDASISYNANTIDVTSKDSSYRRDLKYGITSWSMSGSAFFAEDAGEGYADMLANLAGRTTVTVKISTGVVGDVEYSGTALVSSLEHSGGVEDGETYSFTFEGTGALTATTIS